MKCWVVLDVVNFVEFVVKDGIVFFLVDIIVYLG